MSILPFTHSSLSVRKTTTMSRHRRQPSQALPPEIFAAADDLAKPFQTIAEEVGAGAATAANQATRIQSRQEGKESSLAATSPAKNKAAPPANSA
ncbi:hypothetical protein Fmac_030746 [Flemingia macrophylla]|uniref:Uncharacterized protein n=1 Tax=Flemingia macrophylla TaxID=520843 RepID=A0ABD1L035_9FABA